MYISAIHLLAMVYILHIYIALVICRFNAIFNLRLFHKGTFPIKMFLEWFLRWHFAGRHSILGQSLLNSSTVLFDTHKKP